MLESEGVGTGTEPASKAKAAKKTKRRHAPAKVEPLQAKIAYPLAVLTGFLYFLAFPGHEGWPVWPLAFLALVPLIVALRGQSVWRALGLGWAAGFTMTMCGFYWLYEMLRVFSGFPPVLCVVFMCILCAYQAGRIGMLGWLYARAERRGWPAAFVFVAAFVASELWFPLLFPWYYGATVHNAPVFMQLADIGGPYIVAVVLVAANLGIAELIIAAREGRDENVRVLTFAVALPLVALAYGYARLSIIDEAVKDAPAVKIGIVQGNMPLKKRSNSLAIHQKRTEELREQGVDLVIWSEGATATLNRDAPPDYPDLRDRVTNRLGVPTIVGALLAHRTPNDEVDIFNTAILADKTGAVRGRYDKQYLLAFGEYLPFSQTFPILHKWSPESGQMTSGTSLEPLVLDDHRISALICYEDILPFFVNAMVRHADPDLLVNLTNDAWFGDTTEPWIHLALSKLRAVEHRRFLVRATNSGVSAFIDPVGRLRAHGGTFTEETVVGTARFMRTKTLYESFGDIPWILLGASSVLMAFFSKDWVAKLFGVQVARRKKRLAA